MDTKIDLSSCTIDNFCCSRMQASLKSFAPSSLGTGIGTGVLDPCEICRCGTPCDCSGVRAPSNGVLDPALLRARGERGLADWLDAPCPSSRIAEIFMIEASMAETLLSPCNSLADLARKALPPPLSGCKAGTACSPERPLNIFGVYTTCRRFRSGATVELVSSREASSPGLGIAPLTGTIKDPGRQRCSALSLDCQLSFGAYTIDRGCAVAGLTKTRAASALAEDASKPTTCCACGDVNTGGEATPTR